MSEAIADAVRGALYQEMRLSVISNNLANINTIGYKKDNIVFNPVVDTDGGDMADLTAYQTDMELMLTEDGFPAKTFVDFSPGHIEATGNTLDIAINSDGFFCVETPEGIQYTRKGNFKLNENRELCTQDGFPVLGEGGKIVLDDALFTVDVSGNISNNNGTVDTFKIADFAPDALLKNGNGFFAKINEDVREIPAEDIDITQGYLEQSNVNAVKMMTEMIDTLRGFESYQKIIQYLNETNSKAISELGQTA